MISGKIGPDSVLPHTNKIAVRAVSVICSVIQSSSRSYNSLVTPPPPDRFTRSLWDFGEFLHKYAKIPIDGLLGEFARYKFAIYCKFIRFLGKAPQTPGKLFLKLHIVELRTISKIETFMSHRKFHPRSVYRGDDFG
jgi:hypothetical protein